MSDNYNYSLIKNDSGNVVVRSTVKSFNLDHVTDKDIVSFYKNFSQHASFDTGLLPLDGTGVLAIRTAGPHTQIVTQHAPGMYHINWGSYEGDRNALTYYVAQPYRIVIGDFRDGNLLGARMFYSPYPITSPDNPLYHVNLPNINCKGYRGNAVGWICLYHKDDWSSLPFNEKVSRFIERCSGVETYNDQNMSDTDGPRFYQQNGKPSHLYDPHIWQQKSTLEGFSWTLDPDLWIPVLVKDLDDQDRHTEDGQPLTLAMAILGNYQAYYTDTEIPKMYNKISRSDMELDNKDIAKFFTNSFAISPVVYVHQDKDNPYSFTVASRQKNGSTQLLLNLNQTQDDDDDDLVNSWICSICEDQYSNEYESFSTADSGFVCESCLNDSFVYIESADDYFHNDNLDLVYCVNNHGMYFHDNHDTTFMCESCEDNYGWHGKGPDAIQSMHLGSFQMPDGSRYCLTCFDSYVQENELSISSCASCDKIVVTSTGWENVNPTLKALSVTLDNQESPQHKYYTFCNVCASKHMVCPCGILKSTQEFMATCAQTNFVSSNGSDIIVNSCCPSCLGPIKEDKDGNFVAGFIPSVPEYLTVSISQNIIHQSPFATIIPNDDSSF